MQLVEIPLVGDSSNPSNSASFVGLPRCKSAASRFQSKTLLFSILRKKVGNCREKENAGYVGLWGPPPLWSGGHGVDHTSDDHQAAGDQSAKVSGTLMLRVKNFNLPFIGLKRNAKGCTITTKR